MKHSRSGGYVALLGLLLAVAVMAWVIFWNYDLRESPGATDTDNGALQKTTSTTYIESRLDTLDKAKATKELIESKQPSIE